MESVNPWTRVFSGSPLSSAEENVFLREEGGLEESGRPMANSVTDSANGRISRLDDPNNPAVGSSSTPVRHSRRSAVELEATGRGLDHREDRGRPYNTDTGNLRNALSGSSIGSGPGSSQESGGVKRERLEDGIGEDGPSRKRPYQTGSGTSSAHSSSTHTRNRDEDTDDTDGVAIYSSLLNDSTSSDNPGNDNSIERISGLPYPNHPEENAGVDSAGLGNLSSPYPFMVDSCTPAAGSSSGSNGITSSSTSSAFIPAASIFQFPSPSSSGLIPGRSNAKGKAKERAPNPSLSPTSAIGNYTAGPSSSSGATVVSPATAVAQPRKDLHPKPISLNSDLDPTDVFSSPISQSPLWSQETTGTEDDTKAPTKTETKAKAKSPELDESTLLSSYTCPVCFCPPTNATLTPCGHICCGSCLFSAVKSTMRRGMGMMSEEGGPRCPVCRTVIPGWDGKGGGVIGLRMQAVFSL